MNRVEEVREREAMALVKQEALCYGGLYDWDQDTHENTREWLKDLLASVSAYEVLTGVSLMPAEDELTAEVRRIVTRIQKVADAEPFTDTRTTDGQLSTSTRTTEVDS